MPAAAAIWIVGWTMMSAPVKHKDLRRNDKYVKDAQMRIAKALLASKDGDLVAKVNAFNYIAQLNPDVRKLECNLAL